MKKQIFLIGMLLMLILFFPNSYSQQSFIFTKKPIKNIIISEFNNVPLIYSINITNGLANADYYKFFTLLDARIFPNSPIKFEGFETKTINLTIYVKETNPGKYTYSYYIKNSQETYEDSFSFEIVKASDAFTFDLPQEIDREAKEFPVKIKNNLNINFYNLTLSIDSVFINGTKTISLAPREEKTIKFNVGNKIKKEYAGKKTLFISLSLGKERDRKYGFKHYIFLKEYENITTKTETKSIFIGKKITLVKENSGNKKTNVTIAVKFNPFEKLFVKSSIKPDDIRKEKGEYVYIFKSELNPDESFEVEIIINYVWLIFSLIVLFVIVIVYYYLLREKVVVKKKVKKVKIKSGKFALKVFLTIQNKTKRPIREVSLLDYLPLSLRYYEYGLTPPDEVRGNKLYWAIGEIATGEVRTISYLCYSKIKYEGKLELPRSKLKYVDEKGKHIVYSTPASIYIEREEKEEKEEK